MVKKKKPETESHFQTRVTKKLRENEWKVTFWTNSKYGGPGRAGFPDLICYRERFYPQKLPVSWVAKYGLTYHQVMTIELKTNKGPVRSNQVAWLNALETVMPAYVLRPRDEDTLDQLAKNGYLVGEIPNYGVRPIMKFDEWADGDYDRFTKFDTALIPAFIS